MRRLTPAFILLYLLTCHVVPAMVYASDVPDHVVKVFYFHRRFRCPECVKTEYLVQKALTKYFSTELKKGEITWQIVDVSVNKNRHYLTDYGFMYNTVMVVDTRSGEDVRYKNLEGIYDIMEDEEASVEFIRKEVKDYLKPEY